jgi:hypothetical protein
MFHLLGHFTFHGPGLAHAAAGKNQRATNSDRDCGGVHGLNFAALD